MEGARNEGGAARRPSQAGQGWGPGSPGGPAGIHPSPCRSPRTAVYKFLAALGPCPDSPSRALLSPIRGPEVEPGADSGPGPPRPTLPSRWVSHLSGSSLWIPASPSESLSTFESPPHLSLSLSISAPPSFGPAQTCSPSGFTRVHPHASPTLQRAPARRSHSLPPAPFGYAASSGPAHTVLAATLGPPPSDLGVQPHSPRLTLCLAPDRIPGVSMMLMLSRT